MMLTRRDLFAGLACAGFLRASPRPGLILEAVSGPQIPHRLAIPAFPNDSSIYFERREYRADSPASLDRLHQAFFGGEFSRCGIRALLWQRGENLVYLFGFDSLAARAEAWTAFASDPAWIPLRESVRLAEVSVYRRGRSAI
jgi:hypothetical protein